MLSIALQHSVRTRDADHAEGEQCILQHNVRIRTTQSPSCGRVHAAHMHAPTGPDNEKIRTMKRFDCAEFGSAHIHAPTGPASASLSLPPPGSVAGPLPVAVAAPSGCRLDDEPAA